MTRSPATAIQYFDLAYDEADPKFANAFIDHPMFEVLLQTEPDPMKFWEMRAERLAERLHGLQYVSKKD
jgi:pyridoxine/pyridoxamine 5'-phosphate oxidase